jgi:hypothetical protein
MTYMRSWKSYRLTSHTWLGLNPQIGRPLSRIVVPLVYFYFLFMKKYTFGGLKGKNRPPEPKNGIWGLKSVWSCDIFIDQEFNIYEKNIYIFRGRKFENEPAEPKNEIWGPKSVWSCPWIYRSGI